MDLRVGFFLVLLGISYISVNSRNFGASDVMYVEEVSESYIRSKIAEISVGKEPLCKLCEEYASQALHFLSKKETQKEILSTLYQACSSLVPLKNECLSLVNHYVKSFFKEISDVEPDEFCEKVKLCKDDVSLHVTKSDEACTLCHNVVVEILIKLKDPDTQLEVIKILFKSCNKMENYVQQCKKVVLQYVPLILLDAETVLQTYDVCTTIHACNTSKAVSAFAIAAA